MITIDWKRILPVSGSQSAAFEELCAQLAREQAPEGSHFVRTGAPDAGVECYCTLTDGAQWGWQAKYFLTSPDSSQWAQIDHSVRTALDKHPNLTRYFVCVPVNLPDGQQSGRTSGRDRWNERVVKWTAWATEQGMTVEFVWWGDHELLTMLTADHHAGRRLFFFGQTALDANWFRHRLDQAKSAAGPRYTPEVHVDTPTAHYLEAFARTEAEYTDLQVLGSTLRKHLRYLQAADIKITEANHGFPITALCESISTMSDQLASLEYQPNDVYPLSGIQTAIADAIALASETSTQAHQIESRQLDQSTNKQSISNPFSVLFHTLNAVQRDLNQTQITINRVELYANAPLLVIEGRAGIGKTHLLCDFAERHISVNAPVVLLMGQTFTSNDNPMRQAMDLLLPAGTDSFEVFVDALTSAAQAANRRALFIIDAINEGNGPAIWPVHLPILMQVLRRSEWIGTVLSVRDGYTERLIPEQVCKSAASIRHFGFQDVEFDAVKSYCSHYGIEMPSTPILNPEFNNPLWLKTICTIVRGKNERRLPRGTHGVMTIFNELMTIVNRKLADPAQLDYDSNDNLVSQAANRLAKLMAEKRTKWIDRDSAKSMIDSLLPGRPYSQSLFRGMVLEGIISEFLSSVYFSYDRMTDHLVAQHYLGSIESAKMEHAFENGGPLAFVNSDDFYHSPEGVFLEGIIDALSVYVPELIQRELLEVAPLLRSNREAIDSFCRSIVWRDPIAITATTKSIIDQLAEQTEFSDEVLDALLTVAVIDNHPLNADYLDQMLKHEAMATRDAWWTTSLYDSLDDDRGSAVKRLVSWASSLTSDAQIDDSTIDLAATALGWLLTSSNRFLRDKTTKALVNMLDGRLLSVQRLIERFQDVNDPYVAERVYAVAYGVVMRSTDASSVEQIARQVYDAVFADGKPPAHILLRDYARNIVERAQHLGTATEIDIQCIQPPYRSEFPVIPTGDDIRTLEAGMDSAQAPGTLGHSGWSAIRSSVMGWDFARYIIGTNSTSESSYWLSLSLNDPRWSTPEERYAKFVSSLNRTELAVLVEYETQRRLCLIPHVVITFVDSDGVAMNESSLQATTSATHECHRLEQLLLTTLSSEKADSWWAIHDRPPRLDLGLIQRYVLRRVIDLGWSAERFDSIDSRLQRANYHRGNVREGHKPERIGKKYQWIAYHEILAHIADHYQYETTWGEKAYSGPWQIGARNIDPSTLPPARIGDTDSPSKSAWWTSFAYDNWQPEYSIEEWIANDGDIPALAASLIVDNPGEPTHQWITAYGFQVKTQPTPLDDDVDVSPRREVWIKSFSFLVPKGKSDDFATWARSGEFRQHYWNHVTDLSVTGMFWGEHGWAPAANLDMDQLLIKWPHPTHTNPSLAYALAAVCSTGFGEYDCSEILNSAPSFYLPNHDIISGCNLHWTGTDADYIDVNSELAAFDPSSHEAGPAGLLIRSDILSSYLAANNMELCWVIIGEKQTTGTFGQSHGWLDFNGAYIYRGGQAVGHFQCVLHPKPNG